MTKGARHVPRSRDEQVLRWMALRQRGLSPLQIVEALHETTPHSQLGTIIDRVKADDIEWCHFWCERATDVLNAYWPALRKRNKA